jgi:hypothetical protein
VLRSRPWGQGVRLEGGRLVPVLVTTRAAWRFARTPAGRRRERLPIRVIPRAQT